MPESEERFMFEVKNVRFIETLSSLPEKRRWGAILGHLAKIVTYDKVTYLTQDRGRTEIDQICGQNSENAIAQKIIRPNYPKIVKKCVLHQR